MTPLLTRLEQELAVCTDPFKEAELLAERACYFARAGNFASANAIAASLRQGFGDGRSVCISVWIMLIEGLVLFFESKTYHSHDRIQRAYAISKSAGLSRLRALTGVWLAHMEFERTRYPQMAATVIDVLNTMDHEAHDAASRLGIVLGDAFLYAGDRPRSQYWYERSRWHSTAIGDQATVGALMYNRAAFGLAVLRANQCAGNAPLDHLHLDFIELELQSAISFQGGTGVSALTYLVDLCTARIAVLRGRFQVAAAMFGDLRERTRLAHNSADTVSVDADLAWCLSKIGRENDAYEIVSRLSEADIKRLDADDQLIAACAISEITGGAKSYPVALKQFSLGELRAAYNLNVNELRKALEGVVRAIDSRSILP